ncbi:MAG: hypothetical protein ACRDY6_13675 [Acidimicrobiia bacterium]
MANKTELAKAYDAGQAAQVFGDPDDVCPFELGSEEHEAYMKGKTDDLADKWLVRGGRRLARAVSD